MTTNGLLGLLLPFVLGALSQFIVGEYTARRRLRDSRADRRLHHLAGIAERLEVEMRVYEDVGGSSSTTGSSRLKSASGGGRARPAGSSEARQRSSLA